MLDNINNIVGINNRPNLKRSLRTAVCAITTINYLSKKVEEKNKILDNKICPQIKSYEEPFSANNFMGLTTAPDITYLKGTMPIIVSAPHAVSQLRYGKVKPSDAYTGALASSLNNSCGSHSLIKSRFDGTDPNMADGVNYKKALLEVIGKEKIKFLIDLHCMNPKREEDIVIGTNNLKNIQSNPRFVKLINDSLNYYGFYNIKIDTPFSASSPNNVSRFISETAQIPCLQIEINLKLLDPEKNPRKLRNILRSLQDFIRKI